MSDQEPATIVPIREQQVNFYGDTIYAVLVRVGDEERVYVPIKPISDALGLAWHGQYQRIRRDDELSEVAELIPITGINITPKGGNQQLLSLPLEFLHGWLFGVQTSRVREELRDKVRRYKLECYRALNAHFQAEALSRGAARGELAQIRGMGLAIARMAEQQMQLEEDVSAAHSRLDKAAQVFTTFDRRLSALEGRVQPSNFIIEDQAQEVAARVKALAEYLTSKGPNKNHYQGVFQELYRRFGVSGYKAIRQEQYEGVLAFLDAWRQSAEGDV